MVRTSNTMWSGPVPNQFFSHYVPRSPLQPQMPDMKQVKRSVCNHIRHFSLLSYLPSAGNPSTQPPIRRLALPLIRSIIQPNARASSYQPTTQSPSFHQPRHTLHFYILSILVILSKTSTRSTRSTRLSKPPPSTRSTRLKICYLLFVYLVYFVVQFFASFAFCAARHSQKG